MNLCDVIKRENFGIDAFTLKMIAIVTMLIDHIGCIFFPEYPIFRIIGRIAFPVFAFMIVEGFLHTRNLKKYAIRLAVFALISELPFDYAFFGGIAIEHQNVLVTFLLAVLAMYIDKRFGRIAGFGAALAVGLLAEVVVCDYGMFGIIVVMVFYWNYDKFFNKMIISSAVLGIIPIQMAIQVFDLLALIPIALYNGKKGISIKYFFYAFYPGHLVVLYIIHRLIG